MKALRYHGEHDIRGHSVPDPILEDPVDVIIREDGTGMSRTFRDKEDGCITVVLDP
jgi:hypothetical protein